MAQKIQQLAMNFLTKSSGTTLILTFFGGCVAFGYAGNMLHQGITGLSVGADETTEVAIKALTPDSFKPDQDVAALRQDIFSPK